MRFRMQSETTLHRRSTCRSETRTREVYFRLSSSRDPLVRVYALSLKVQDMYLLAKHHSSTPCLASLRMTPFGHVRMLHDLQITESSLEHPQDRVELSYTPYTPALVRASECQDYCHALR